VQALAYGDLGNITESFFDEIVRATPEHRFVVLVLCGLVGDAAFANSTISPLECSEGVPYVGGWASSTCSSTSAGSSP
jgi:hypothetical protein